MDFKGSDLNKIINARRQWFQFTGEAGSRLLDTCPLAYSCGTVVSLWSDESMPDMIGIVTPMKLYEHDNYNCGKILLNDNKLSVVRCSDAMNDFRHEVCGMN